MVKHSAPPQEPQKPFQLDKWGFTPIWPSLNGFLRGARLGRGRISLPKWPETGVGGAGLPGKVKIGKNMIKTKGFKGIRGRIVQTKNVEIDP